MYLEIDEGFPGHRKTLRMCSLLKNPEAGWYMIRLWTWACRSCPSGILSGLTSYDLEMACQYRKLDGACYSAMVAAGFIDTDEQGPLGIHGWMKHTGGAIKRMEEASANKKAWRDHRNGKCGRDCSWCDDVHGMSKGQTKDVHGMSKGQTKDTEQDKPTQTRPDQTSQDKTREDPPSAGAPARSNENAKTAHDWLVFFQRKYWEIHGRQYGQGSADAKALGNFGDLLESLPSSQRAEDWGARDRIATEFLKRTDARTVQAGWPFCFFATDFRGLALPPERRPAIRAVVARDPGVGYLDPSKCDNSKTGDIPL